MLRRSRDNEAVYRRGANFWAQRDLDRAVETLEEALAVSKGPGRDPWWHSMRRALAQIALEVGDLEGARMHLSIEPPEWVGAGLSKALRAKLWFLDGDEETAGLEISTAVAMVLGAEEDDLGSLMNGAMAMAWCAETLVEMGHGAEASRVIEMSRQRIARTGVLDRMLEAILVKSEATAARLIGAKDESLTLLDRIDPDISPDLVAEAVRERARHAWEAGDRTRAESGYREAAEMARADRYLTLADLIEAEATAGPPPAVVAEHPVETWIDHHLQQSLEEHQPYGLVLSVTGFDGAELPELIESLAEFLEARPDLGVLDGTGTDGQVWEVFANSEDPAALWEGIQPLVGRHLPGATGQVTLTSGDGETTLEIGDSGV